MVLKIDLKALVQNNLEHISLITSDLEIDTNPSLPVCSISWYNEINFMVADVWLGRTIISIKTYALKHLADVLSQGLLGTMSRVTHFQIVEWCSRFVEEYDQTPDTEINFFTASDRTGR